MRYDFPLQPIELRGVCPEVHLINLYRRQWVLASELSFAVNPPTENPEALLAKGGNLLELAQNIPLSFTKGRTLWNHFKNSPFNKGETRGISDNSLLRRNLPLYETDLYPQVGMVGPLEGQWALFCLVWPHTA